MNARLAHNVDHVVVGERGQMAREALRGREWILDGEPLRVHLERDLGETLALTNADEGLFEAEVHRVEGETLEPERADALCRFFALPTFGIDLS